MRRLGFFILGMTALVSGCNGGGDADFEPLPDDVCAKQHRETTSDGFEVTVCDALHAQAPFVRLPEAPAGHAFAGIEALTFVTTDGATYDGAASKAEEKRHGVALYELAIEGGRVTDHQPALIFDEAMFIAPFMGRSFEGLISRRSDDMFAFEASLPVRVDILDERVPGSADFEVRARIANAGAAVAGNDGSCLPSLASYGEEAPFAAGTELELHVARVPSMHDFGDDHFVMDLIADGVSVGNLMSPEWYRGPIDLVRGTLSASGRYLGFGHGTPGAIPTLELEVVAGGGEPCEP